MIDEILNKKNEARSNLGDRVLLVVRTSRTGEETPESMVQFLASLTHLKRLVLPFWGRGIPISLEIAVINQAIHFFVSVPARYQSFVEGQIVAVYPKALITKSADYLPEILTTSNLVVGQMKLTHDSLYPIRTFTE